MSMVIVGGGLAGAKAVEELRERGYDGSVTLLGAEPHLPYERPPLSKSVLLGEKEPDSTKVHDAAWYADHDVDVRTSATVAGVDVARQVVTTGDGDVGYDKLLLATGSEPRRFAAADDSGARVAYLRTLDDCAVLRAALQEQPRVVIVGAGWIGLEVAAAARTIGCEVTVVEPQSQPLLGVMGERIGATFADLHRAHGVDLRLGTSVEAVEQDRVVVSGGEAVPAGLVVVAVGAAPRLSLADAAGLATGSGVLVDARLRTADPHVYAAGDIADHDHPVLGHRVRVEHWDNAIEQGKVAARNMLGEDVAYERAPYFFTDQYDLGMEYVGHAPKEHTDSVVVRGDLAEVKGIVAWHDRGTVLAAMHVNEWDATDDLRSLLGRSVDLARFEDPSVPLSDLVG
jgi:3-phenylpropionate/trans-cinnamate dioxygenase ferredoxin reductase subunit